MLCLHYYSNSLGFVFGDEDEEVYRIDQIKEWAPDVPNWLDNVTQTLNDVASAIFLY